MTADSPLPVPEPTNATFSDCGQYRYSLERRWGEGKQALWVMLNPSTADATEDDPTIRRCIAFSKAWGCGSLEVVNLFALRATNPKALVGHPDPVGPANFGYIYAAILTADLIVYAWGAHKMAAARIEELEDLRMSVEIACEGDPFPVRPVVTLGLTKDGHPRHPLYVPSEQEPVKMGGPNWIAHSLH